MAFNDPIRAEASRLRRQATKKVSRIKHNTGALISGTSVDPRHTNVPIRKMDQSQLHEYTQKLKGFLSRKEQFVAGSRGTPIHRDKWQEYKRVEAIGNANVLSFYNQMKDVRMPDGKTIAEKRAIRKAEHPQMTNPSFNTAGPLDRTSKGLDTESAIEKWITGAEKRGEGEWLPKHIEQGREQWRMMMDKIDLVREKNGLVDNEPPTQRERVEALSDEQFAALLLTPDFMEDTSTNYEYFEKMFGVESKAWVKKRADDKMVDYDRLITWAENIKVQKPEGS